jgi:hypothetical protein
MSLADAWLLLGFCLARVRAKMLVFAPRAAMERACSRNSHLGIGIDYPA